MHGLILRTFQVFIQDTYGPDAWLEIAARADLEISDFEAMLSYAPETFDVMVVAAEKVLKKPSEVLLEDIGTYLVSHPNSEGLRRLLRFGGVDYIEFMHSLDDLPDRARLVIADLSLPSLELQDEGQGQYRLVVGPGLPGFGFVMMGVMRAIADDYGALVMLDSAGSESREHGGVAQVVEITLFETAYAKGRDFELAGQARKLGETG